MLPVKLVKEGLGEDILNSKSVSKCVEKLKGILGIQNIEFKPEKKLNGPFVGGEVDFTMISNNISGELGIISSVCKNAIVKLSISFDMESKKVTYANAGIIGNKGKYNQFVIDIPTIVKGK